MPRGLRLLCLALVTLYMCVCVSVGLGSSLSKHTFDIQKIVASVSNKNIVLLLLIGTENLWHIFCCLI